MSGCASALLNVWATHTPEQSRIWMELTGETNVELNELRPDQVVVDLTNASCLMWPDQIKVLDGLVHHLEVNSHEGIARVIVCCEAPVYQPHLVVHGGMPFQICLELSRTPVTFHQPFGPLVIDPACGGRVTGARGPINLVEKKLNLDVARYLKSALLEHNVAVILTRESDDNVPLEKRALLAKKAAAFAMITVGMGASKDPGQRGTRTKYSASSKDSHPIARHIHAALLERLGTPDLGLSPLKASGAGFAWVKIEPVVLTNKLDEALMRSPTFKERIARAVTNGLLRYLRERGMPT